MDNLTVWGVSDMTSPLKRNTNYHTNPRLAGGLGLGLEPNPSRNVIRPRNQNAMVSSTALLHLDQIQELATDYRQKAQVAKAQSFEEFNASRPMTETKESFPIRAGAPSKDNSLANPHTQQAQYKPQRVRDNFSHTTSAYNPLNPNFENMAHNIDGTMGLARARENLAPGELPPRFQEKEVSGKIGIQYGDDGSTQRKIGGRGFGGRGHAYHQSLAGQEVGRRVREQQTSAGVRRTNIISSDNPLVCVRGDAEMSFSERQAQSLQRSRLENQDREQQRKQAITDREQLLAQAKISNAIAVSNEQRMPLSPSYIKDNSLQSRNANASGGRGGVVNNQGVRKWNPSLQTSYDNAMNGY